MSNDLNSRDASPRLDRRGFLTGAAVAGAGLAVGGTLGPRSVEAEVLFPNDPHAFGGGGSAGGGVNRSEIDLFDCEVEGQLPADLDGTFFRVGPDPQYPKPAKFGNDIGFDGEGHVSMFRIKDGHVDYRTRYARTQRWKAQHAARQSLFGMYRNPFTDDPRVTGLSRGTANTQLFYHHGKLLVYKEDSPPVAMNPLTLETTDDYYTFGGALKSLTHTAHPKIDPVTGEYISFGYEAKGLASDDIYVFSADRNGKINWEAWIKPPYVGMLHDFAVTQKHIAFFVTPLATNMEALKAGKVHFAWDSTLPSYMGVMRRGGDGRDCRWFTGQQLMCTHTMGAWSDGETVYVDMDGGEGNQFPFFPSLHEPFDPQKAVGRVRRFKINLANRRSKSYEMQTAYPEVTGVLSRQDDRFHTLPYRYGFMNSVGPQGRGWVMFDHQKMTTQAYSPGAGCERSRDDFRAAQGGCGRGRWLPHRDCGPPQGEWAFGPDPGRHPTPRRRPDRKGEDALPRRGAGARLLGAGRPTAQGSSIRDVVVEGHFTVAG
jgi:carotenoid cleavage dioxygenase-like enzyme